MVLFLLGVACVLGDCTLVIDLLLRPNPRTPCHYTSYFAPRVWVLHRHRKRRHITISKKEINRLNRVLPGIFHPSVSRACSVQFSSKAHSSNKRVSFTPQPKERACSLGHRRVLLSTLICIIFNNSLDVRNSTEDPF